MTKHQISDEILASLENLRKPGVKPQSATTLPAWTPPKYVWGDDRPAPKADTGLKARVGKAAVVQLKTLLMPLIALDTSRRAVISTIREGVDLLDSDPNTKASFGDLVKQTKDSSYGYGKAFPMKGWAGRIVGFVGDVLLDPLTYATLGSAIPAKAVLKGTNIGTRKAIFGATSGIKSTAGREGRETLAQFSQKRMTEMLKRGDTFGGEVVTPERIMGITRDIAARGKSSMPEWLTSELGIRGPGVYYFGSRVRVPGTGIIGGFLEKGLVDIRLASVTRGGPIAKIQEMLAPHGIFPDDRGVKMAHVNLARGKMSPEKAGLALDLLEGQTKYRIAAAEFGEKANNLLHDFVNGPEMGAYAEDMHRLLDQVPDDAAIDAMAVALGLRPEAAQTAKLYRSYMDQLIDEVDQRMLTIDPTWETGRIKTGYFPRFESQEMNALRLSKGNEYVDGFMGKPGFSISSNYNSRELVEGTNWFDETLTGFETLDELNNIAIASGHIGDIKVFETDGYSAMQQYARSYSRQHGNAAFMEHFFEQGSEKYLRLKGLTEKYTTMDPGYRVDMMETRPREAQDAAGRVLSEAAKNSDRGLRAVDDVLSRLYGSLDTAMQALRDDALPPQNVDELLSALDDALKAQVDAHTNYKAASEAFEAMLENVDGNSNYNLVVAERRVLSDLLEDWMKLRALIDEMPYSAERSLAVGNLLDALRGYDARLAAHARSMDNLSVVHDILPNLLRGDSVDADELIDTARAARAAFGGTEAQVDIMFGPKGEVERVIAAINRQNKNPRGSATRSVRDATLLRRARRVAAMDDADLVAALSNFTVISSRQLGESSVDDAHVLFSYVLRRIAMTETALQGYSPTLDMVRKPGVGTGLAKTLQDVNLLIRSRQHPEEVAYMLQNVWHAHTSVEQFLDYAELLAPYGIVPGDDAMSAILRRNKHGLLVDALARGDNARVDELRGVVRGKGMAPGFAEYGRQEGDGILGRVRSVVDDAAIYDLRPVEGPLTPQVRQQRADRGRALSAFDGAEQKEFREYLDSLGVTIKRTEVIVADLRDDITVLEDSKAAIVKGLQLKTDNAVARLGKMLSIKSSTTKKDFRFAGRVDRTLYSPGATVAEMETEFRSIFVGHPQVDQLWAQFTEEHTALLSWIGHLNGANGDSGLAELAMSLRLRIEPDAVEGIVTDVLLPTPAGREAILRRGMDIETIAAESEFTAGDLQSVVDQLNRQLLESVSSYAGRLYDTELLGINRAINSVKKDLVARMREMRTATARRLDLSPEEYFGQLAEVRDFVPPVKSGAFDYIKAGKERIAALVDSEAYPVYKSAANHVENLKILSVLRGENVEFGGVVFTDKTWRELMRNADDGSGENAMKVIIAHARKLHADFNRAPSTAGAKSGLGVDLPETAAYQQAVGSTVSADVSDAEVLKWFVVEGPHTSVPHAGINPAFAAEGQGHALRAGLDDKFKKTPAYKFLEDVKRIKAEVEAAHAQDIASPDNRLDVFSRNVDDSIRSSDELIMDYKEASPETIFDGLLGRLRIALRVATDDDIDNALPRVLDEAVRSADKELIRARAASTHVDAILAGPLGEKSLARLQYEVVFLKSLRDEEIVTPATRGGQLIKMIRERQKLINSMSEPVDVFLEEQKRRAKKMFQLVLDAQSGRIPKSATDFPAGAWPQRPRTFAQAMQRVKGPMEKEGFGVLKPARKGKIDDPVWISDDIGRMVEKNVRYIEGDRPTSLEEGTPIKSMTGATEAEEVPLENLGPRFEGDVGDISTPEYTAALKRKDVFSEDGDTLVGDFDDPLMRANARIIVDRETGVKRMTKGHMPSRYVPKKDVTRNPALPYQAGVNEPIQTTGVADGLTSLERDLAALVPTRAGVDLPAATVARDAADALVTQLNSNFDVAASLLDAGDPARVAALMDEMQGIADTLSQARLPQRNARQAAAHQTVVEAREIVRRIGELKDVQEIDQVMRSMVVFDARIEAQFALLGTVEAEARLVRGMQDAIEGGGRLFASGEVFAKENTVKWLTLAHGGPSELEGGVINPAFVKSTTDAAAYETADYNAVAIGELKSIAAGKRYSDDEAVRIASDRAQAWLDEVEKSGGFFSAADNAQLAGMYAGHGDLTMPPQWRGSIHVLRVPEGAAAGRGTLPSLAGEVMVAGKVKPSRTFGPFENRLEAVSASKEAQDYMDLLDSVKGELMGTVPPQHIRTGPGNVIRDGWEILGLNNNEYKGLLASPEFKELWDNVSRLEDPAFVRKLLYYTGDFTKMHKAFATLTPGFHVRNAIANAMMWVTGGVRLENMKIGTQFFGSWYSASKTGTLFEDWARTQAPEAVEALLLARKMVLGSGGGIFSDTFRDVRNFVHPAARQLTKAYNSKILRTHMKFGQESDNFSRFVMAYDSAVRGQDVGMGSARIKKFYFDYEDLSSVDRVMKQVIPFWIWTSRNLALHMQNMWLNPKPYAIYNSFKRNLRDTEGEEERYPSPFMQEVGAFKLPFGERQYLQPDFGFTRVPQQLNELGAAAFPDGDGKLIDRLRYLNQATPLLRAPVEQLLGQNIFNKKKLDDTPTRLTEGLKAMAVPVGMSARLFNPDEQNRSNAWKSFFGSPVRSYR